MIKLPVTIRPEYRSYHQILLLNFKSSNVMFNGISFVKIFRRAKGSLAANGGHLLQTDKTHPRKTTNNSTL